jgi:hypothetical protein
MALDVTLKCNAKYSNRIRVLERRDVLEQSESAAKNAYSKLK